MKPELQNSTLTIAKNPCVSATTATLPSRNSLRPALQQRHKTPEIHLSQLHKIVEEQRCRFENLDSTSLLFYLPIILILFYFWL
jgi:hypothetical protein